MKPTTLITLLAAWIWAFQGCDNKHKVKETGFDKVSTGSVTLYKQIDRASDDNKQLYKNPAMFITNANITTLKNVIN